MKILLDTNLVIDFLERREQHFQVTLTFINESRKQGHILMIAAHSVDNIVYILRKKIDHHQLMNGLKAFFKICQIAPVNQNIILSALLSGWKDFEDSIQYHCALSSNSDLIVTRNQNDYEEDQIPILSPEEGVKWLKKVK